MTNYQDTKAIFANQLEAFYQAVKRASFEKEDLEGFLNAHFEEAPPLPQIIVRELSLDDMADAGKLVKQCYLFIRTIEDDKAEKLGLDPYEHDFNRTA